MSIALRVPPRGGVKDACARGSDEAQTVQAAVVSALHHRYLARGSGGLFIRVNHENTQLRHTCLTVIAGTWPS